MDDIQDGNPAVIGKPLRPVALRPFLSKGVPLLNRGQGAVRGCSCLRITSHFEGQRYVTTPLRRAFRAQRTAAFPRRPNGGMRADGKCHRRLNGMTKLAEASGRPQRRAVVRDQKNFSGALSAQPPSAEMGRSSTTGPARARALITVALEVDGGT